MGKFLMQIYVNDVEKTAAVNEFQLTFFVNTVLSNPINNRYRSLFEGHSLLEVFRIMTANLKKTDLVKISNGTKIVELTVQDWEAVIDTNLKVFTEETVKVNVSGKTLKKDVIQIESL